MTTDRGRTSTSHRLLKPLPRREPMAAQNVVLPAGGASPADHIVEGCRKRYAAAHAPGRDASAGHGGAMRGGPLASGSLAGRATASRAAQRWILGGHKLASERANWPLLTRPTVRGLPVVCSSPHAAGRRNCRAPRRLGSGWRGPSPTGDSAAAGSSGAPYGGCATLRRQHPPPTPERADTRFSTP